MRKPNAPTGHQWIGELWTEIIPDPEDYRQRQEETVRLLMQAVEQQEKIEEEAEGKCPS